MSEETKNDTPEPEDRTTQLEQENRRLQRKLKWYETIGRAAMAAAILIAAGPRLVVAFKSWMDAISQQGRIPAKETGKLGEAILRRFVRVGVFSAVIAIIPSLLLIWQNILIRSQNQYFQEQNKVILDDSTRARRAQLIATIYDEDCGPAGAELANFEAEVVSTVEGSSIDRNNTPGCPPKAHVRSRVEAALALIDIDRGQEKTPSLVRAKLMEAYLAVADLHNVNLWGVDLQGANLQGANLQGTDLREARLRGALLQNANLQGANLQEADLRGAFLQADLQGANLQGANLQRVFLRGADLRKTILQEANLQGVNLWGVDLRGAEDLTVKQLSQAFVSENTKLPDDLEQYRAELLEAAQKNLTMLQQEQDQERE